LQYKHIFAEDLDAAAFDMNDLAPNENAYPYEYGRSVSHAAGTVLYGQYPYDK
jgi:hypothetical protein